MKEKAELTTEIIELLVSSDYDLYSIAEILGNILTNISAQFIYKDKQDKSLIALILDDHKTNGETLANSLGRQGLLMLSWLDQSKNKRKKRER